MSNTIQLLPYFDKSYPGTVAKVSLIVAVAFLVIYLILTRNRRYVPGTWVPIGFQNACIVGLGLACWMFTYHTLALEVDVVRTLVPEWASLLSRRTLPDASEFADVALLQFASILIIFSAFWYSFPYRSQARKAVRRLHRGVCGLPLLNRIGPLRDWVPVSTPIDQYPELDALTPRFEKEIQDSLILSQYGVYLVVLANLWALAFMGVGVMTVTLITTVFFIVLDDWAIIADYSRALKGRMFDSHKLRITATNLVLTVALVFTTVQAYSWTASLASIIPLALFFLWRYWLAHRIQSRLTLRDEQLKELEEELQRTIAEFSERVKHSEAGPYETNDTESMPDLERWRSEL